MHYPELDELHAMSDDALHARRRLMGRRGWLTAALGLTLISLAFLTLLILMMAASLQRDAWFPVVSVAMVLIGGFICTMRRIRYYSHEEFWLTPLADGGNGHYCVLALKMASESPSAREWVAEVNAANRQLYYFDYQEIKKRHAAEVEPEAETEQRAACRALHAIA